VSSLEDRLILDRHELLEGVVYERREGIVILRLAAPWQVLSSAVLGGGRRHLRSLVHLQVPLSYDCDRPERDLRRAARALALEGPTVGLMTAVDLAETQLFAARAGDSELRALITVGLRNASRPGEAAVGGPGTINMVLLCARRLAEAAAIELAMLASEAKAAALVEVGVQTRSGHRASRTSTDAIAILWRRAAGREFRHAGSATEIGSAVGRIVTDAIGSKVKSTATRRSAS
jgi:iron complex transport system ATP-binding protein